MNSPNAPDQRNDSHSSTDKSKNFVASDGYWSKSLKIVGFILAIWLFISLGCGILLRDVLDATLPNVGGAPFGFWMAQQGSIIGFLILLVVYMFLMNGLDRKYGFGDEERN